MNNNLLNNNKGMAIIMVTTAVAILSFILVEFTFETKLNKIRVENQVDRYQAKLNAEAGLKLTYAKLKIYRQAWNTLEDNEALKKTISPSIAEKVITAPFIYPISLDSRANIIQKNAVADFEKNNLLTGELSVAVTPITGFLNPNSLKVIKDTTEKTTDQNNDQTEDSTKNNLKAYQFMEKTFIETMDQLIKSKIENDEDFALKYSNINVELLIKELKYYVNNPADYDEAEKVEIEKNYELAGIAAKHAPMENIEEMYMLQGWDDTLVNLIKDKISVHQVSIININEITQSQLKVLFPMITDFQLESFFKKRNGDKEQGTNAEEFKDESDFRKLIVEELAVLESSAYDDRIKEYERANITLGVAAKLFKVVSIGKKGQSKYALEAYIDLPLKPNPPEKKKPTTPGTNTDETIDDQTNTDEFIDTDPNQTNDKNEKKPIKRYLLEPRIVEVRQI